MNTCHTVGRSVEEVLATLPKDELVIASRLRSLILECLPYATEKLSYGAPFYSRNRMICFIWPPYLVWNSEKEPLPLSEKGVTLGFCQGNLMSNENGILKAEKRKQMYCMYFKSPTEIKDAQIRALLFEADMIDNSFSKKSRLRSNQKGSQRV